MARLDAFRHIDRDKELKEEILTRIAEDPAIAHRLITNTRGSRMDAAPEGAVGAAVAPAPAVIAVDEARDLIESPPETPVDRLLEAIVLVLGRPVLLVQNDDFDLAALETDTWRARLEPARARLQSAIPSVGRIDLDNNPQFQWGGTGWVVADDIMVTNRHVADLFARREQDRFVFRTSFLGQMGARLDFREELDSRTAAEFRVADVLHIEDDGGPDLAFLQIDWGSNAEAGRRAPIQLAGNGESARHVAVIGYPAKDTRTGIPQEMDRIFGQIYDVKRLAPGEVTGLLEQGRILAHDCTTLGGNSGSVVLDLETGKAVALHFAGREKDRNFAVAALAVRSRLQQLLKSDAVSPIPSTNVGAGVAAPTLQDMDGRDGYVSDFLGPAVPHPALSRQLKDALVPVVGNAEGILDYSHYSLRMHRFRRLAMYTAVNIDGSKSRNVRRERDNWNVDPRIDPQHQVGNELYQGNKLDRGHLVRRLDPAWGDSHEAAEAAALDTFFYTNCAPQHKVLNQQLWLGLEDYILTNADVRDLRVSVFSGPVFRAADPMYRGFLIPEDFWKIVAVVNDQTSRLSVTGYMLSQRDFMDDLEFAFGAYETYQVPIAIVENQSGLDFGNLKDFDPLAEVETAAVRPLTTLGDIRL